MNTAPRTPVELRRTAEDAWARDHTQASQLAKESLVAWCGAPGIKTSGWQYTLWNGHHMPVPALSVRPGEGDPEKLEQLTRDVREAWEKESVHVDVETDLEVRLVLEVTGTHAALWHISWGERRAIPEAGRRIHEILDWCEEKREEIRTWRRDCLGRGERNLVR